MGGGNGIGVSLLGLGPVPSLRSRFSGMLGLFRVHPTGHETGKSPARTGGLPMNERFARAGAIARVDLAHEPDFVLGKVQVRPGRREIVGAAWREIIDPRVMQVLVALARAQGEVVSRDDLIESCWDGVIVGEDAINRCINRLRKTAEASSNAFSIETVPRVGYRLNVAVSEAALADMPKAQPLSALSAAASSSPPSSAVAKPPRTIRTKWLAASAVTILLLAAVGFGVWRFWPAKPVPTSVAPVEASVAVLPFVNMSGDPKQEYFSDGFSEELVNDLANVPHLFVASRTSSFAFKGKNENIKAIARALDVHAIVEGSVRQVGDRVRITAQLINAADGYHLWSADYTRNLTDVLSLQDEIAQAVASELTHRLAPAPAKPAPRIDPAVYRLYLEGIREWNALPPPENMRKASVLFQQVITRAPDFADGYARLANAAINLINYDAQPAPDIALFNYADQKALSLDPHNLAARVLRANMEVDGWNWRAAASDLQIVRSQNPNTYASIDALWYYYLNLGFWDQAMAAWQPLPVVEPDTWRNNYFALMVLDEAGRFRQEIAMAQTQLVQRPRDTSRLDHLCESYAALRQIAEAQDVEKRLRSLQTDFDSQSNFQDCEWYIDVASGNRADALRIMHLWEQEFPDKMVQATMFGARYVVLGDFDRASEWFERAYERRETHFFANVYSAACIDPACIDLGGFGYGKAFEAYRLTPGYKTLAEKPLFREWQAEHDRIAIALLAHKDPLSLP